MTVLNELGARVDMAVPIAAETAEWTGWKREARVQPYELCVAVTDDSFPAVAGEIGNLAADIGIFSFYLGRQSYRPVLALQKRLHAWRVEGRIPDVVLLLEHEPVYTLGKNARREHLLPGRPLDVEAVTVDRGGDVTYHGPGQLVGYPIIDLREHRPGVRWYIRGLEEVIIRTLAAFGVDAGRRESLPGVWVQGRKIAALGVRLARWVTRHGFALNVDVPRRYYDGIVPCGLEGCELVNLNDFLDEPEEVLAVARRLAPQLDRFLGRSTANDHNHSDQG